MFKERDLKRSLNRFRMFGDLDGCSFNHLLQIRGIGKKSISLLQLWFREFHSEQFTSLVTSLPNHQRLSVGDIMCSPRLTSFLERNTIQFVEDISSLDSVNLLELDESDRLAILELRTLRPESSARQLATASNVVSRDINLVQCVDDFLEHDMQECHRKIVLSRWNIPNGSRTLERVGRIQQISKERVRQIIASAVELFKKSYLFMQDEIQECFLRRILNSLSPVSFLDLNQGRLTNYRHYENFYVGFLSDVFHFVPFKGHLPKRPSISCAAEERQLFSLASRLNCFKLSNLLKDKDPATQTSCLKTIFCSNKLRLSRRDQEIFLNRNRYGLAGVLKECIEYYDRPTTLTEFAQFANTPPVYPGKREVRLSGPTRQVRGNAIYYALRRDDEFVMLDFHVWGLRKHMGYPKERWHEVQSACRQELKELGHQAGADFLYRKIRCNFPGLRSKYELVMILRDDSQLTDLGFYFFALVEWGQTQRIKVSDLVYVIFEEDPEPKSTDVIWKRINKYRYVRREGFDANLKQMKFIKQYKPSYFGLKSCNTDNLRFLSHNADCKRKLHRSVQTPIKA